MSSSHPNRAVTSFSTVLDRTKPPAPVRCYVCENEDSLGYARLREALKAGVRSVSRPSSNGSRPHPRSREVGKANRQPLKLAPAIRALGGDGGR